MKIFIVFNKLQIIKWFDMLNLEISWGLYEEKKVDL